MDEIPDEKADDQMEDNDCCTDTSCAGCSELGKQVLLLRVELALLKKKFERTEKLLEKAEFERDSSSKYVESFREQVSQLHEKLAAEKKKNENVKNHEQEERGDWSTAQAQPDTGMDIASSIREAAKEIASSIGREIASSIGREIASSIKEASKDIATSIREAAQQATTNHGFIFDEKTGLYYDYSTGYYYDPNTRLYYDYRTGIYYKYNQEKGTYEFYSQIAVSSDSVTTNSQASSESVSKRRTESSNSKTRERSGSEKREIKKIDLVESGSEDGEIVEVDDVDRETQDDDDEDDDENDDDEVKEKEYPPCIRAIVMESDKLSVGSLNIITCMGLTFGRTEGGNNNLRMSDIEVSKEHAKVYYDEKSNEYFVKDLGSQNGTFINGSRLSESKQESEGHKLSHGEKLKIGSTTFLLHIHPGNETCDDCEPGQVQAQIKAKELDDEVEITRVISSVKDKNPESLRKKELKRLKKRYMLQNSEHEMNSEIASNTAGKYKDRAQNRRKKVGSEAPNSDVTESPSSVFKPIKSENKGRMMLEKMGWVDGEGLGKTKTGRTEPVMATMRQAGRGLGYGAIQSIDMPNRNSKSLKWNKAQERYNAVGRGQSMTSSQGSITMNWVKKAPKPENIDIFADET